MPKFLQNSNGITPMEMPSAGRVWVDLTTRPLGQWALEAPGLGGSGRLNFGFFDN